MHSVVELPAYLSAAKAAGLSEDDRSRVVDHVARNPAGGDVIRGAGGARKVRIARPGGGKSGGYRVITAYLGEHAPVLLLTVYAKNERTTLSEAETAAIARFLSKAKEDFR